MCGRYALPHQQVHRVAEHPAHPNVGEWIDEDRFVPRYNIAPRTYAPVIRRRSLSESSSQSSQSDSREDLIMQTMRWGLVPSSENFVEGSGGIWGSIKGKKRCAVVAHGYYEWLTKGKDKLPHFIKHTDSPLMLMAGLYDCVTLKNSDTPLWTFTIVTTPANPSLSWLHDRQPLILSSPEALRTWLDTSLQSWTPELTKLVIHPTNSSTDREGKLECYQVPKEVGKVGTESPSYIEPVSQRKDGIEAMFAKAKSKSTASSQQPSAPTEHTMTTTVVAKSSPPSPPSQKRKRTLCPDPDLSLVSEVIALPETGPSKRSFKPAPSLPPTPKKPKNTSSSPKKTKAKADSSSGSAKITSFFKKE
ncbi:hypothetical protein PC9H_008908 [Pleurotus ostreatus]|uniref:DUF159-domain-containing protein n=1 Tax=Pleurotus ostreatus TaxID=5322 RepID=A0A8H7DPH1_PLEOS|nr:uncharacterized protein PC9H_008908 [Pleurotus ostreatus]KAF7426539.1 hypothetical protein PC9H_008908 [Pleurotus ostreatus]KAJ8694102.1 hypothetical protein PTI98_009035 [Pleurotus ostreatus]